MTNFRLITRSACALSAAILATTALQSTPAEATSRAVKAGGHTSSSAHAAVKQAHAVPSGSHGGKQAHAVSSQPDGGKQVTGSKQLPEFGRVSGGSRPEVNRPKSTNDGSTTGGGFKIPGSNPGGDRDSVNVSTNNPFGKPILAIPAPIPPATGPINPGNFPGGNKTPPVTTATPTPGPIPPVTGPINPGNLPGSRPPVLTPTPTPAPIPPVTGPINPGNYPGSSIPPILSGTPTPAPIPVPTGSSPSPNPGYGTGYAHRYGHFRVYADVGAVGDGYAPCWWLRDNYDRTGNVYWLNRYKVCLWQH
jgi:hypothetical protein